jgi:gas vesicle protein
MFGFGKKKQEKKQGHLDKILMGVIVGGAIGSVLGVGLAPKKGSETRKEVGRQTGKALRGAKKLLDKATSGLIGTKKKPQISKVDSIRTAGRSHYAGKSIPEEK